MEALTDDRLPGGGRPPDPAPATSTGRLSLDRVATTLVDRWLPANAGPFVAAVLAIGAACWLVGFLFAADKHKFLESRDWQCQPLYLAAHFATLRMFVSAYAKNFLSGCRKLTITQEDAETRVRRALGAWGWVVALALAAPLVGYDLFAYLPGAEFAPERQGPNGTLGRTDFLLGAIWTLEWIINAYIWTVILAFLARTMRVLREFRFREDVDVVLGERHYRPFLMMSAQGATIVLLFSAVNAFYVWYADGGISDMLGLVITSGLLISCFVPPWMRLKGGVVRSARAEFDGLNREVQQKWRATERNPNPGNGAPPDLSSRIAVLLAMARAGHLERLYRDFGRNEGGAMILRLLAPLVTVGWRLVRPLLPM